MAVKSVVRGIIKGTHMEMQEKEKKVQIMRAIPLINLLIF